MPVNSADPSAIIPQSASAVGITSELGLAQRWIFGNWTLNGGLYGGALFGILQGATAQGYPISANQTGFGGTLRFGSEYRFTPNFLIGADLGFRYYFFPGYYWTSSSLTGFAQPITFNAPLASFGPVLLLKATYQF
jgi:hypothetical protein